MGEMTINFDKDPFQFKVSDLDTMELFRLDDEDISKIKYPIPSEAHFAIRFNFKDGTNKEICIGFIHEKKAYEIFDDVSKVIKAGKEGRLPVKAISLN